MAKLSTEATIGLGLEVLLAILERLHVREPWIIWGLFVVGLLLIGDSIIRGEWADIIADPQRRQKKRMRLGAIAIVVFALFGWWIFARMQSAYQTKESISQPMSQAPPQESKEAANQTPVAAPPAPKGTSPKKPPVAKKIPTPPAQPPQTQIEQHGAGTGAIGGSVNQGPCSNLQIGGSDNQQTTNCFFDAPLIKTTFRVTEHSVPSTVSFKLWVDRNFPNAKFVIFCDHPCKAVAGHIDWEGHAPSAMIGPDVQPGTVPDIPNTAAFAVDHPEVLGPDVSLVGVVKSSDDAPLKLFGAKALEIKPPR